MHKFKKTDSPDIDLYESHLRKNGYIVYDQELMQKIWQYATAESTTRSQQAVDTMLFKSGGRCCALSRDVILNYLLNFERCPEHYFSKKGMDGYSLDKNKVLMKLYGNNYATEFLDNYMEYKSLVSKCGKIRGILEGCNASCGTDRDGVSLKRIPYSVNQQKNLRYNYRDQDIIGIPKDYNACISVEDGYFLAWGDFAQSDFRIAYNLFMRSQQNDEIMNKYEDKYEALARMVAQKEGTVFDKEQFLQERQIYKRLTLATVYGTRNSTVPEEDRFVKRMTEFLNHCPKYVEYVKRLNDRCNIGLPMVLEGYFGDEETVANKYNREDIINDSLNTPIQMGTSEIVILTVNAILSKFKELGYSEDDVSVYYVRHDEPVFKVSEKTLKDAWVFNEFSTILIDDWTPLRLDFDFGYHYKQSDEELVEKIKSCYESNQNRVTKYEMEYKIDTEYYPIPPTAVLFMEKIVIPGVNKTIVAIYSEKFNAVNYHLINSSIDEEVQLTIKENVRNLLPDLSKLGFCGVHIFSDFMSDEDFASNTYVKYEIKSDNSLANVVTLCRYMTCLFVKKNQLSCDVVAPAVENEEFIKSVQDLSSVLKGELKND